MQEINLELDTTKLPRDVRAIDVALVLAAAGLKTGKAVKGACMERFHLLPLNEATAGAKGGANNAE